MEIFNPNNLDKGDTVKITLSNGFVIVCTIESLENFDPLKNATNDKKIVATLENTNSPITVPNEHIVKIELIQKKPINID